jgi:HEAT repeat protein
MARSKVGPVLLLLTVFLGLWQGSHADSSPVNDGSDDEKLLKAQGIATDNAGLLAFLRQKTAREAGPEAALAAVRVLVARHPPGAVDALVPFASRPHENWVKEEVLAHLGTLAVWQGTMNAALLAAAKHEAAPRRATAAYVLAQRGGAEQRDAARRLLADPEASVRQAAAGGLAGKRLFETLKETTSPDAALLKEQHVATDEGSLLEFLRRHTLSDAEVQEMHELIRKLGDNAHRVREEASHKLTARGAPALPLLTQALESSDAEVVRRARLCIEAIQRGPSPALPAAVVRQLVRRHANPGEQAPSAVVQALLGYLPFADDDTVEEEVRNGLIVLVASAPRVDTAMSAALKDALPARRAAAAFVLGRVGSRAQCQAVHRLLEDPSPLVRLYAAQGLLPARDRAAVPALVAGLASAPLRSVLHAEELLHRVAGERAPAAYVGEGSPDGRRDAAAAWAVWWQREGPTLDLMGIDLADRRLGLMTICEYDSPLGRPGGKVWECGRNGKPRWKITGVSGPMDARVLPGGRVLIAEHSGQRVTERDLTGAIKWQQPVKGNPIACQRLPSGNTFIATYHEVMEVTPTHQIVYIHNRGPGTYLFSAQKVPSGRIICMTAQGTIIELDAITGKQLRMVNVMQGGWCGVESLAGGKFLVAVMASGQVREVDASGKALAQWFFPGAFRATRLPSGHTLVASMTTRKIAELDRSGKTVWEHLCEGRPWQVHWR